MNNPVAISYYLKLQVRHERFHIHKHKLARIYNMNTSQNEPHNENFFRIVQRTILPQLFSLRFSLGVSNVSGILVNLPYYTIYYSVNASAADAIFP